MDRRLFSQMVLTAAAGAVLAPQHATAADAEPGIFTILKTRRSVRAYTEEPVSDADMTLILKCAMLAPSAANEQLWEFVVIKDKSLLEKASEINPYASFAKRAPVAVLLCLNEQKEKIQGMGIIDMGTCAENLMLAAAGLGLGSVFTGIYPMQDRMEGFAKVFELPPFVKPIGLIVIGHPKISEHHEADRFNPGAIHNNKW